MSDERFRVRTMWGRFAAYGLIGWCGEVAFTGVHDFVRTRDRRLPSRSSLWMFPIYGLLAPLYEPLHDATRDRLPAPVRAALYGGGFLAVEYATGRLLRRLLGRAPWDYSYARRHVDGLILGGTELSLILREATAAGLPVLDTTQIHVDAALERLLGNA